MGRLADLKKQKRLENEKFAKVKPKTPKPANQSKLSGREKQVQNALKILSADNAVKTLSQLTEPVNETCHCKCHTDPKEVHIGSCCYPCDKCGKNIVTHLYNLHIKRCKKKR